MEDIVALAEQAGIYEKYRRELSEAESGERERETKRALSEKYSALAEDIRRFLSNGQFALVLNKLTLLFKGVLSYEGGALYYRGRLPEGRPFDCDGCFALAAECERKIMSDVQSLVRRTGNADMLARELCDNYATLGKIAGAAKTLCERATERELAAVRRRCDELRGKMREMDEGCGGDFEARVREKIARLAKERASSDSAGTRLQSEREGNAHYGHAVFLGTCMARPSEDALSVLRGLPEVSAALSRPVSLSAAFGQSAVFFSVDGGYERRGDEFYDALCRMLLGAMTDFEPGGLRFAFAEGLEAVPLLAPLYKIVDGEISPDCMYRPPAKDKAAVSALLGALLAEMKSRQTSFRTLRKEDGRTCADIAEYNARNPDNALPYILLAVHGYPLLFEGAEVRALLKNLVLEGGPAGIFVAVFGQNAEIPGMYGAPPEKLDLPSLGMREICVRGDGGAVFEGAEFRFPEGEGFDISAARGELRDRLRRANTFYLDSILQESHDVPFEKRISVPLGNSDGRLYSHVTGTEKPPYPFTLVTGAVGSGKSAFLHAFIMSAAMKYSPDELQFHIIDFKTRTDSQEFLGYLYREGEENLYIPHVRYLSLRSRPENALDVIRYIKNLMNERNKLGKFEAYNSSPEVKSGRRKPMPMVYVVIDEYENMLAGGDAEETSSFDVDLLGPKIVEGITTVLKRARTFGIGVIFCGQAVKLPADAMNQINNRIAFYNGSGIFERVFGHWEDEMYARFPAENYLGYAWCAENGVVRPSFVRMAYAGPVDGKRMHALAKRIREKYADFPRGQVVVGGTGSAQLSGPSAYRTWAEEAAWRADMSRIENPDDFDTSGIEEGFRKGRPLALGVSASSGLPVAMDYSTDVNGVGYFACANERTLYRIERNAAFAFLFQTAGRGEVFYCDTEQRTGDAFGDCFGAYFPKAEGLQTAIRRVRGPAEIARLLVEKKRERERGASSSCLVVLHEAEWLEADKLAKQLSEKSGAGERRTQPEGATRNEFYEKLKASGAAIPAALLDRVKGMNIDLNGVGAAARAAASGKAEAFTPKEVREAFGELYLTGNRDEIFLLVTSEKYGTISSVVLSLASDSRERTNLREHGVYGSFEEMRREQTENTSANSCYVLPAATGARLYDYGADGAGAWWQSLEARLRGEGGGK